jgi:hypothetical protein
MKLNNPSCLAGGRVCVADFATLDEKESKG